MNRKEYTMTEKEITKALREQAETENKRGYSGEASELIEMADLIESQAAENAAYRAENERLAADLKDMRDQNQTISEKNRELCIKLDEREKNSNATRKAMLDEIAKLRNDLTAKDAEIARLTEGAASYQQVKKRLSAEGFNDLDTMITRYKQVMADANEIDIAKDEEMEQLRAALAAPALASGWRGKCL